MRGVYNLALAVYAVGVLALLNAGCYLQKVTDPALTYTVEGESAFDLAAAHDTVTVSLANLTTGAFGFQFTFAWDGAALVQPGPWVNGSPLFVVDRTSPGSVTVVGARLVGQGDCAHEGGVLATIIVTGHGTFSLVGEPVGAKTPSPTLRDCSNLDVPVHYGTTSVVL